MLKDKQGQLLQHRTPLWCKSWQKLLKIAEKIQHGLNLKVIPGLRICHQLEGHMQLPITG